MRVLFCCRPAYGHVYPLLPLATGCRDAGHDVLFGTGERFRPPLHELGFRSERVGISIEEADGLALLPHVDVVAHHGGSGTMLGALSHGLPQLVMPHGADQFLNAHALLASRAGRRLLPEVITPEAVAADVRALLGEHGYREAAHRLADEISAMPSPAETVPKLERLASQ